MATMNKKRRYPAPKTHGGAKASRHVGAEEKLRRAVLSCLLWERQFYESGEDITSRIEGLCGYVPVETICQLAVEVREEQNLRHVPLLLLVNAVKFASARVNTVDVSVVSDTIERVIQRPDELSELLALYWRDGKRPLSNQLRKGLARAFTKFDEYQLAKYNRDSEIKLRDIMFMVHPTPLDAEQESVFRRLAEGQLETPDTWEVALSSGADKRETWERLLRERKLGYLAVLRNLRNMHEAKVDRKLIQETIVHHKGQSRVLPFRYVAAARAAPTFERYIDVALVNRINQMRALPGTTAILVDVSGSMGARLSAKSDMSRMDAACALGAVFPGEHLRVFSFSTKLVEVPPRSGMAGVDAIRGSQHHGGTALFEAIARVNEDVPYDRIVVITDEQATGRSGFLPFHLRGSRNLDKMPKPLTNRGYIINVGSYQNGVGYEDGWTHINGFSESVIRYIQEVEERSYV